VHILGEGFRSYFVVGPTLIPATLGKIMGKFRENFIELFAHFEKKMGKFQETCKIFPKFSHDFSQCAPQKNR